MSDLVTTLMGALGCQRGSILGPDTCRRHSHMTLDGPVNTGWPCPVAERVTAALLADPAAHSAMRDALVEVGVLRERVTRTHHVASAFDADGQPVSFAMTGRDAYALRELIAARKYGFHPATHRVVTAVRREWYAEGSPDVEWESLP